MKINEVPQDQGQLARNNLKEICYAVDEKGSYTTAHSSGWEVKTIALEKSLEAIQNRIEDARNAVSNGELSPIGYYMELQRMDIATLADYMGMWQWQVKKHMKPSSFKKINVRKLRKYAEIFGISTEELKNFNGNIKR